MMASPIYSSLAERPCLDSAAGRLRELAPDFTFDGDDCSPSPRPSGIIGINFFVLSERLLVRIIPGAGVPSCVPLASSIRAITLGPASTTFLTSALVTLPSRWPPFERDSTVRMSRWTRWSTHLDGGGQAGR